MRPTRTKKQDPRGAAAVAKEDHGRGVTTDFIRKMQDKGLKNLSLDEYIRLRDAGM